MKLLAPISIALSVLSSGCATDSASPPSGGAKQGQAAAPRAEEAEIVTGSRIPVRGTQPVRTVDKEEITRNTSVIGTPPKGN